MIEEYKKLLSEGYNLSLEDCAKIISYRRSKGECYNAGNKFIEGDD